MSFRLQPHRRNTVSLYIPMKEGKIMWFPMLFERIHELSREDYREIGVAGNPAPSNLRRLEDERLEEKVRRIHVPREPLESELRELIDQFGKGDMPQPVYLFSQDEDFGSRHTIEMLKDYCRESDLPFMELNREDMEEGGIEGIQYLITLAGVDKIVLFCEPFWEEQNFYEKLLEMENAFIIGRGGEPSRELSGVEDRFRIFDLEEDYPFTEEQIYEILRLNLEAVRLQPETPIPDKYLKTIIQITQSPGRALNILGVCLAVAAYRRKCGKEPQVTDADLEACSNRKVVEWIAHR